MAEHGSTRRELVRDGVAAGAVAAAAGPLLRPAEAQAALNDLDVLLFAVRAEQAVVLAYELALASGALAVPAKAVVSEFLGQEREHVAALSVSLARVGGAVPAPPTDLAMLEVALRELHVKRSPTKLHTERQWVSFLVRLEAVLATAYHFVIEELSDYRLIQTAAQIMANEGQHATVLHELMTPGNVRLSVPRAFVGGSS